jgi:hypothetical protein
MNADPNKIANLHARSGYDSHQDDRPCRVNMCDSGSDRNRQHHSGCWHQDHDSKALSQQRTNQQADR